MRKRFYILLLGVLTLVTVDVQAQVGINTTNPDPSSILDVQSNESGVLLPRLSAIERDAIAAPAAGLLIYNTDESAFQYYNGSRWLSLVASDNCDISATPNSFDLTMSKGDQRTIAVNVQVGSGFPGAITTTLFSVSSGFDITLDAITNNGATAPVSKDITFTLENSSTANIGDLGEAIFRIEAACGRVVFVPVNITISGCDFTAVPDSTSKTITLPATGTAQVSFDINIDQAGSEPGTASITFNDLPGITESLTNSPCPYDCVSTFSTEIDNTLTPGTYTYTLDITSDCGNMQQFNLSLVVEPDPRNCNQILSENPAATDGVYTIDLDGPAGNAPLDCYCDMTTDGGGWTLVLNYLKAAGVDPDTQPRNNSLPLLGSSTLGDNEANTVFWGHAANILLSQFEFNEVRFYGETSGHGRIMHFKHSQADMNDYFRSGNGGVDIVDLRNNFTPLTGHTTNLPFVASGSNNNQGDNAMLNRPFRNGNTNDFRIGMGDDWEMDDNPNNASNAVLFRVWVR